MGTEGKARSLQIPQGAGCEEQDRKRQKQRVVSAQSGEEDPGVDSRNLLHPAGLGDIFGDVSTQNITKINCL